jgi:hypothetical protein
MADNPFRRFRLKVLSVAIAGGLWVLVAAAHRQSMGSFD